MNSPDDLRIARRKTVAAWKALRARLDGSSDASAWTEAFEDFFKARLDSRYLEPIEHLEKIAKYDGEGFSIVTIQCSLIEFLASTLEGRNYRLIKKGEPGLGLYEYSASKCMFIKFLANQHPFREAFDKETATKFYEAVRCGLLHEARTKAGWRIRFGAGSEPAVDGKAKIVYRNKLGEAFSSFIEWYRENLPKNQSLQQAFVRRFDSLCVE
jgi:hypothetical protein